MDSSSRSATVAPWAAATFSLITVRLGMAVILAPSSSRSVLQSWSLSVPAASWPMSILPRKTASPALAMTLRCCWMLSQSSPMCAMDAYVSCACSGPVSCTPTHSAMLPTPLRSTCRLKRATLAPTLSAVTLYTASSPTEAFTLCTSESRWASSFTMACSRYAPLASLALPTLFTRLASPSPTLKKRSTTRSLASSSTITHRRGHNMVGSLPSVITCSTCSTSAAS
mmetsp:Transcript_9388/g.35150  ORF Transcript_9388/g.35150 Transcript_9388/m.35150 type:complete len:226 (+) Transcript_9388:298-975(+)